eukprot:scaffold21439_cov69-Phaeocystis_antarctica.AAC.3
MHSAAQRSAVEQKVCRRQAAAEGAEEEQEAALRSGVMERSIGNSPMLQRSKQQQFMSAMHGLTPNTRVRKPLASPSQPR